VSAEALAAVEGALDDAADADVALRAVVGALVAEGGCTWAGILFVEGDGLVLGPEAGAPDPGSRAQLPVTWDGDRVAELVADGCDDRALLERVAALISPWCLVGWDTGGEPWNLEE
jgi:hypothetical protein